jgi:hypothetical protein
MGYTGYSHRSGGKAARQKRKTDTLEVIQKGKKKRENYKAF